MSGGLDDLLRDAEAALDAETPADWGELLELEEGEHFLGRYVGERVDGKYDPPRIVYLLLDQDYRPRYIRSRTVLTREMVAAHPSAGDWVAIVRGQDGTTRNGHEFHRYSVRAKPSAEPTAITTAEPAAPASASAGFDDDTIPF